ncbi:MAG: prepilin-type N-terminal cleavage/methylation domain-containing protein [Planctomycetes bacterium]|nr:prepilin-type N-terminal cleavage/methylation domain-containing protein [Planctomycetota bacterium]
MSSRAARSGFTLIEMMIVVAIIGIVLVALVGTMDDLTPYTRLASGAREVASAIRFVTSEAAASGKTHWLTFDMDDDKYWVVLPRTEKEVELYGSKGFSTQEKDDDRRLPARELPSGVVFEDVMYSTTDVRTKAKLKYEFAPLGFAPPLTIHIRDEEDETLKMTVFVNPVTAETSIEEDYKKSSFVTDAPR